MLFVHYRGFKLPILFVLQMMITTIKSMGTHYTRACDLVRCSHSCNRSDHGTTSASSHNDHFSLLYCLLSIYTQWVAFVVVHVLLYVIDVLL